MSDLTEPDRDPHHTDGLSPLSLTTLTPFELRGHEFPELLDLQRRVGQALTDGDDDPSRLVSHADSLIVADANEYIVSVHNTPTLFRPWGGTEMCGMTVSEAFGTLDFITRIHLANALAMNSPQTYGYRLRDYRFGFLVRAGLAAVLRDGRRLLFCWHRGVYPRVETTTVEIP